MLETLVVIGGYLMGSISCAVIVSRVMALPDPRTGGSGNPGATNVLRLGGKRAALLTLMGDILKGAVPVLIARWLDLSAGAIATTGLAAFLGHLYPIFFAFKGGKGVATAAGVVLAMAPTVAAALVSLWLFVALLFHYSSLAAIIVSIAAPIFAYALRTRYETVAALLVIGGLLLWRHKDNISRLRRGTESRIGDKAKESSDDTDTGS